MNKLLVVLVMFGVAGCSDKAIYETIRLNHRNNCVNEPPTTFFECIERTNKPYDEYERERKEISETKKRIDMDASKESMEIHEE